MTVPPAVAPSRPSLWKWWVCGLLLLATMINYMDRLTLNQLSKQIIDHFQKGPLEYGWLESAFGSAFAIGAIIFGWLADRWNPRGIYALAVLAWSLAGFATGLVTTFAALLICRFLLGLAEAGNWPCALKTTQRILPPAERTMGNSILQSGAAIGAVLTPLVVLGLYRATGDWRPPFLVVGGIGALWVVLWLASVRTADLAPRHVSPSPSLVPILGLLVGLLIVDFYIHWQLAHIAWLPLTAKSCFTVLGIVAVFGWLVRVTADDEPAERAVFLRRALVCAVIVVAINSTWHFLRAWLPLYLQSVRDYSLADVSWFSMAYYFSTDVGSLAAGILTLYFARAGLSVHGSRVAVFALCSALTTLCVLVPFLESRPLLIGTLLVIGFGALGLFPPYYSLTQELSAKHQGKVSGAMGCINWLVMALMQESVGERIQHTGSYAEVIPAAGLVPLLGLVALLLLLFWGPTPPADEPTLPPMPFSRGDKPAKVS
jgi:ACS family hexuronate transporter-like MFS transporter